MRVYVHVLIWSGSLLDKKHTCCLTIRPAQYLHSKAQKNKSACHASPAAAQKWGFVSLLRKCKASRLREDQHLLNVLFLMTYNASSLSDIFILPVF